MRTRRRSKAAGLSKHVGLSEYNGEADAGSPVSDNYDPRAVIAGANAAGVDTGPTPSPTHTPLHSSESQEEVVVAVNRAVESFFIILIS